MLFALFMYLKTLAKNIEYFSNSKAVQTVVIKNPFNPTVYIYSVVQTVIN